MASKPRRTRSQRKRYRPGEVVPYGFDEQYGGQYFWCCYCESGPERDDAVSLVVCQSCQNTWGHVDCYGLSLIHGRGGKVWDDYTFFCLHCTQSDPTQKPATIPLPTPMTIQLRQAHVVNAQSVSAQSTTAQSTKTADILADLDNDSGISHHSFNNHNRRLSDISVSASNISNQGQLDAFFGNLDESIIPNHAPFSSSQLQPIDYTLNATLSSPPPPNETLIPFVQKLHDCSFYTCMFVCINTMYVRLFHSVLQSERNKK